MHIEGIGDSSSREPISSWQKTAPQFTYSSEVPATSEAVVVGGGLLGASTAYWLARSGGNKVMLLL